jgi:lipopolysaccharide transport system ATP-binding protein
MACSSVAGFLVRFTKEVAPGYCPPTPEIHHPTGYWLSPALIALQHGVPVVWNAPGSDGNDIPKWANPLLEIALTRSSYVAVRDQPSRSTLETLTSAPVVVVPDTAFGLPRLLNLEGAPSAEFTRLCEASGLRGPYIVLHARRGLEGFTQFIKNNAKRFRNFQFLALPIGPGLGDRNEMIDAGLPGLVRLPGWPSPLAVAELIGRAEAAVGESYHFCIAAISAGVPVFTRHNLPAVKYSVLRRFEGVFDLPPNGQPDLEWFLAHVGRGTPSAAARATYQPLSDHWDRIAAALLAEPAPAGSAIEHFWQSLPALLEDAAKGDHGAREAAERRNALDRQDSLVRQLTVARAETAARDARIAEIHASLSWRLTAPLRFVGRHIGFSGGTSGTARDGAPSLIPQRHHRIDARGSAGGNVAGQEPD